MKNRNTVKAFSFIIALLFVVTSLPFRSSAIELWDMPALGEVTETTLAEGVEYTKFDLTGGKYGLQKINVLEVDLKQRNLSLEVVTGQYITSKMTMENYLLTYNYAHEKEGKKMIAAVNGALWMTGTNSKVGVVASKIVTIPRGVVMHDGEILCSNETYEEAAVGGGGPFFAFALTDDYVPIIGVPMVDLSLKNVTKNTTVVPTGLNRLPANNALMVYNGKCGVSNYALEDAYEVIVSYKSGEYVNGGLIKGTVTGIAKGGETPLGANTIILSARGDHIPLISGYSVGDELELSISITDTFRKQDDLWKRVKECIPGHMLTVADGEENSLPDNSNYPCTMAGYKSDGTVVFIQNDGRQYLTWSNGLRVVDMPSFCKQLGINTMINLDGGGSSTMIVGEDVVNRPSDGSQRPVINGIGIVVGPERAEQGEVPMIEAKPFDPVNVEFNDPAMVLRIGAGHQNAASAEYDAQENAAKLYSAYDTNDAYLGFSYSGAYSAPKASTYKAIAVKYKTSPSLNGRQFEVFLCAGSIDGPTGGYSQLFTMTGDNEWHYGIIDCSSYSWWTGDIHMLRLDFIAGNSNKEDTVYVKSIQLCKTVENANGIANGTFSGEESMEPVAVSTALKAVKQWNVDSDEMLITGVKEKVGEETIRDAFKANTQNVKVKTFNDAKYAGTGTTVQYKDRTYTVVVKGDSNGDGEVNVTDYIVIKRHFLNVSLLEGAFSKAADTDANGKIDATDYINIKRHLLNISPLF